MSDYSSFFNALGESNEYWTTAAVIEFTQALAKLMDEHGIGKADLAREIGTSPSYITKVLGGDANFTLRTMNKLLRPFHHVLHVHAAPEGAIVIMEYDVPANEVVEYHPRVALPMVHAPVVRRLSVSSTETIDTLAGLAAA